MFEALIENGMMSAVSDWLSPLPDKSLPALEIRTELLKLLQDFARLDQVNYVKLFFKFEIIGSSQTVRIGKSRHDAV